MRWFGYISLSSCVIIILSIVISHLLIYKAEMFQLRLPILTILVTSYTSYIAASLQNSSSRSTECSSLPTTLYLSDPPYENYFYADCHVAAHAVVLSPLPESNLTVIGPRLLVAWPAGNSGVCAFFEPQNGVNGTLSIQLINSTTGQSLLPVYEVAPDSKYPRVGVRGTIRFNSSATLAVSILGSVRTIRDFTEGPSLLVPKIQDEIKVIARPDGGAALSRLWLDNVTTVELGFVPVRSSKTAAVEVDNRTLKFEAGDYQFFAAYNYPQLARLNESTVLNPTSQELISSQADTVTSLSFLSYSDKLLAGTWRFLTYFGRDSMIAALLLQPVISDTAMEAVIGAVLERINNTSGTVAHEETIGSVR